MSFKVELLKTMNKLFPLPPHPFNKGNYGMWQFEKGEQTIQNYTPYESADSMFRGKYVLDVGCGAGGKSLYYASLGAKKVIGIDILKRYKGESEALAEQLNITNYEFLVCDASRTDFADESFDTIIMNDAMEHVQYPAKVLGEMKRILKPSGKIYINFPPYNHPYGAHLSDAIGIPWVHLFFSDKTLIQAYKELVQPLKDGWERVRFRIGINEKGKEYFSYINKMTIRRFKNIIASQDLTQVYYREIPLRKCFKCLCRGPAKEYFVKAVVAILEK